MIEGGMPNVRRHRELAPISERHLESVDVRRVWEHWCKVMGKRTNAKLTPERRKKIQARLKEGYAVERIMRAIDGCHASDFHMARREYGGSRMFNDLTLICRSGSKLEEFEAIPVKQVHTAAFLGESA